jgi:hypothetical protein
LQTKVSPRAIFMAAWRSGTSKLLTPQARILPSRRSWLKPSIVDDLAVIRLDGGRAQRRGLRRRKRGGERTSGEKQ